MQQLTLLILATLLLASCASKEQEHQLLQEFPNTIELQGKALTNFDQAIGAISIATTDNYILIGQRKLDHFYSVYSKDSLSFITTICTRGNGPNEFVAPLYRGEHLGDTVFIFDRANAKYYQIDLNKHLYNKDEGITEIASFSTLIDTQIREVFSVDKDQYLYASDTDFQYYLYNSKQKTNTAVENKFELNYEGLDKGMIQKMTAYNSASQQFVSAYYSYPKITFSSIAQGATSSVLYANQDINPKITSTTYFMDIVGTKQYVCALYANEDEESTAIVKFNWDGQALCLYELPYWVDAFTIDEENGIIYTLSYDREDHIVGQFTHLNSFPGNHPTSL